MYEQSQYVAQIFIHGDSFRNHVVAIAVPEFTIVKDYCQKNGLEGHETLEEILEKHGEVIYKVIQDDLERLANENKFNSLEKVRQHFRLVPKEFEIGTILTPTMKLRRHQAKEAFADLIEDIYAKSAAAE